jgi:hypothetical protein
MISARCRRDGTTRQPKRQRAKEDMIDLTKLYQDWIDKRLAWATVRREKEELLLKGIVDEIEALKARVPEVTGLPDAVVQSIVMQTLVEHRAKMAKIVRQSNAGSIIADLPRETVDALASAGPDRVVEVDPTTMKPAKRGPGRPPKSEAA